MSDASTADKLKAEAARYQADAMALEGGEDNATQDVWERSLWLVFRYAGLAREAQTGPCPP